MIVTLFVIILDKPRFPAGVRTNQKKKKKWCEISLREEGELGRQFSEARTYLAAWLAVVTGVCLVVGLVQPRERRRRRWRRSYRGRDTRGTNLERRRRRHSRGLRGMGEAKAAVAAAHVSGSG
jgi:hypothetical protein